MNTETVSPGPPSNERPRRRGFRPGSTGRALLAAAIAVGVVLAGIGVYAYIENRASGSSTLVIYAFPSLFNANCAAPNTNLSELLDAFGSAHGVRVEMECPGASGTLLGMLTSPPNGVASADLVIGLDEITATQADQKGLLVPYQPRADANIPAPLVDAISPDHSVTPYDFGDLAIDYTSDFSNATHGAVANLSLPMLAANSSWADTLAVEDPIDTTGEEFLLSEIAFYQSVLHQDWTSFWTAIDHSSATITPDWSTAFADFANSSLPRPPQMVVSYGTDPAYESYYGLPPFQATVYHWNGTEYAWKTVYGVGIVHGSSHLSLDQQFIEWFLGPPVQSEIATNDWEYPANSTIALPPSYVDAVDVSHATLLNPDLPLSALPTELPGWLDQWQQIDNSAG